MQNWWKGYPWRMIQTNLRQIDMEHMDAVRFVQQLKDFEATVVLLNAAGIIASYDTKLPFQPRSEYLHGDSLRMVIDECHKAGIRVIARTDFSKIQESVYRQHPEWAYRTGEGKIVNYNGYVQTCPNGGYQQEMMFEILQEVLTTHPFDGVFCNMSGFFVVDYSGTYHGPCHCENCHRKYKEQFGEDMPIFKNPRDPAYKQFHIFMDTCETEHKSRLYDFIKGINPELAVNGIDYQRSESNTDIGRPQWVYGASTNSRVISGADRQRPADNACVDFLGFRYRNTSVSPALMELRQWQNLANSGNVSLYIMGHLDTHLDISSFAPTKKVFHFHKENETFYQGLVSAARVVLLRKAIWIADEEVRGWTRALTESHIPFDEMFLAELDDRSRLADKDVVILGNMKSLTERQAELLDEFAASGGTVIASGETGLQDEMYEPREVFPMKCLGIKKINQVHRNLMSSTYLLDARDWEAFPRCKETPYIAPGGVLVEAQIDAAAKKYFHLIPEHPFGPPERCYYTKVSDIPGVTVYSWGQGQGIYIPWLVGSFYYKEGYQNTLLVMQDILFTICGIENPAPELTPMVELTLYQKDRQYVLQLVNNSGCFANSYFPPLPIRDINLVFKDIACAKVETLNGGRVEWHTEDRETKICLDELGYYEAVVVTMK